MTGRTLYRDSLYVSQSCSVAYAATEGNHGVVVLVASASSIRSPLICGGERVTERMATRRVSEAASE